MAPAPPLHLFLEVTSVCNLRCAHCYVRAGEGRRRQLEPEASMSLLEEFVALGGQHVSVSGGEPTLHEEWRAIIRYGSFLGLRTMILTNATRLDPSDIAFFEETGCAVAISLDGGRAASHDLVRGVGNFDRTLENVRALARRGLGPRMTLMFTPMASNAGELASVVALADREGVETVYVSLLEDRGRAHDNIGGLDTTSAARASLVYSVLSLQERYPRVRIESTNLKLFTERLRGLQLETDPLDRTLRVTADGDVYLTAYLGDEPFHLGKFTPGRLASLWYAEKVGRAQEAAERRRLRVGACRGCAAWDWCRGGSAAFAWVASGSFEGEDGYCAAKRHIVRELGWT